LFCHDCTSLKRREERDRPLPIVYAVHCGLWKTVAAVNAESAGANLVRLREERDSQPACLFQNVFLRMIAPWFRRYVLVSDSIKRYTSVSGE